MDTRTAIIETIHRFANGLDLKDWKQVRSCFADLLHVDYRDLRGDPPSTISANDYVEARQSALQALNTQHLSSNHVISIDDKTATCHSQMMIFRRKGATFFNTHCFYEHTLISTPTGWKISAIKQKVWWNEGDPDIHSGVKHTDR